MLTLFNFIKLHLKYFGISIYYPASTLERLKLKWVRGSQLVKEGDVISPDLKNPKEHEQQAAQSMIYSYSFSCGFHNCLNSRRILGVMGNFWELNFYRNTPLPLLGFV